MKKVILIAVSLFTISTVSNAQEMSSRTDVTPHKETKQNMTAEQRAQKNVDHINTTVTLTEDQKSKVLAISLDKAKKMDVVNEKYKNDPEKNNKSYAEVKAIKVEYKNSLNSILTADQMAKLRAKQAEMKAAGKESNEDHE